MSDPTMIEVRETGLVYRDQSLNAWQPSLVRLDDGSWLCGFWIGSSALSLDGGAYLARSTDDVRAWSAPVPIFPGGAPGGDGRPTTHAVLLSRVSVAASGSAANRGGTAGPGLVAAGGRWYRDGRFAAGLNTATLGWCEMDLILTRSVDGGRTWTAPETIRPPLEGPAWEICHAVMELADGRWLLPTSTWLGFDGQDVSGMKAVALVSEDRGRTWPYHLEVFDRWPERVASWEISTVQLPDGRLLAVAWAHNIDNNTVHPTPYALARDGPRFDMHGLTGFLGQNTTLLVVPDGRVLAVYRHASEPRLWATLARLEGDQWVNLASAPLWRAEGSGMTGGRSTGEELVDLPFGGPALALRPDGDAMLAFWCLEKSIYNIRWIRIGLSG